MTLFHVYVERKSGAWLSRRDDLPAPEAADVVLTNMPSVAATELMLHRSYMQEMSKCSGDCRTCDACPDLLIEYQRYAAHEVAQLEADNADNSAYWLAIVDALAEPKI